MLPRTSPPSLRRFLFFVVFVVATGVLALLRTWDHLPLTPDGVRDVIHSWGHLAPLVFTGAFVVRPFIFFPSSLLFLAGGLAFGVGWGTAYAAVGGTVGAVIGFMIARLLGRDFIESQLGDRLRPTPSDRWGAGLVFVLSLMPLVPMTAINYGAGLSSMGVLSFTAAVIAGLTPRAFAYSLFGNSLLDLGSGEVLWALALLLTLLVLPWWVHRHFRTPGDRSQPQA